MPETSQPNRLPTVFDYQDVQADRALVTAAALIARIQTGEMRFYFALALDHGVKPAELSEIVTHLAFYCGWGNALAALPAARALFHERGITVDQLPRAQEKLLPIDEAAEARRAAQVGSDFGAARTRGNETFNAFGVANVTVSVKLCPPATMSVLV